VLTGQPATEPLDPGETPEARADDYDPPKSPPGSTTEATAPAVRFARVESEPPLEESAACAPEPQLPDATADAAYEATLDAPADAMLPPIFDAWQDDQIRRQFGPMGIDSFGDPLSVPLTRGDGARSSVQAIVLIGRGAAEVAGKIAESLVRHEIGAFHIHVADPRGEDALDRGGLSIDSPLREFLSPIPFPRDPEQLEASLEQLHPRAIVARDFLSREDDVAPWLACLERATARGASLVFSEGTGNACVAPPPEVAQIGERIWELMPERYTREAGTDRRIER